MFITVDRYNYDICSQVPVTPVVDDDLLEFLVRVADNPAEWNKIRRVLSKYLCDIIIDLRFFSRKKKVRLRYINVAINRIRTTARASF